MILLGASVSPYVRKVLVVAAEKGIKLDNRAINPTTSDDPLFLAASPFRKIPALVDGDFQLADSTAIVTYLEALHPAPAMLPAAPKERARAVWFEEMSDTVLFPAGQKVFFNRVVAPKFLNRAGDLAAAQEAQDTLLPPVYDYLEGVVPAEGFLVGKALTIADVALAAMLVNMTYCNAAPAASKHPKLAGFLARMMARPSFAAALASDRALLG
ncbi:MAG: glutathione S-transferase family protein [Steroidobacteraceae bacterium]